MAHQHLADTVELANRALERGDFTGWFEELYQTAAGDPSIIPWAGQAPNPYLIEWLQHNHISGDGKRALVIGCGLGDDAEELSGLNFKVTAFDISHTAIEWAKKRFTKTKVDYRVADLFALPEELTGAFDFIFECYTIQALPRSVREQVIEKVASVVAPGGELLIVCRGWREDQAEDTLPWALKRSELEQFNQLGFSEVSFEEFWDKHDSSRYRFRILYQKSK